MTKLYFRLVLDLTRGLLASSKKKPGLLNIGLPIHENKHDSFKVYPIP